MIFAGSVKCSRLISNSILGWGYSNFLVELLNNVISARHLLYYGLSALLLLIRRLEGYLLTMGVTYVIFALTSLLFLLLSSLFLIDKLKKGYTSKVLNIKVAQLLVQKEKKRWPFNSEYTRHTWASQRKKKKRKEREKNRNAWTKSSFLQNLK